MYFVLWLTRTNVWPFAFSSRYLSSHRFWNPVSPTAKISSRIRHLTHGPEGDRGTRSRRPIPVEKCCQLESCEALEFGEREDLVDARTDFAKRTTHDGADQVDVVDRVEFRIPAHAELENRRHGRVSATSPGVRLGRCRR